jgi:hypothetical protein
MRVHLLLPGFIVGWLALSSVAAPPVELVVLQTQYEHAVARRVTAVHEAAVGALNARFTTALDNAISQAKSAGDLTAVLAIQGDKKLLADKQPLPADDDKTPEALKKLRGIYRDQLAKLIEQRSANATTLLTPYTARLKELEATLTKADRIAEAQEVLAYREGLKADAPPVASKGPAERQDSTAGSAMSAAAPKVKGDDRKAAEWTLFVGGAVELWENASTFRKITKAADLPAGRIAVRSVLLDNNNGALKPVTDADLAVVGGLDRLEAVQLQKLSITTAAFDVLATCPSLHSVILQYNSLGDDLWPHLAGLKKLKKVAQGFDGLPVRGIGLSHLSRETMEDLFLGNTALADEALPELGSLTQLTKLDFEQSKVTDAGMPALAPLKKLVSFNARGTHVTVAGLASLKGAPLISIGYGISMDDFTAQLPQVAALFPKLATLFLPREVSPVPGDWAKVASALPQTRRLMIRSRKLTDAACEGLEVIPELEEIEFGYCTITDKGVASLTKMKKLGWLDIKDARITDAALDSLASMKKLKTLALPTPGGGLTAEGIAKLKRQRPDMTVR